MPNSSDLAQFEKKILTFFYFSQLIPYRPRGTEAAAAATFLLRGRPEKKSGQKSDMYDSGGEGVNGTKAFFG